MESVTKIMGTVRDGKVVLSDLPFADGDAVEMMVWSPKIDDLAPDPSAERTPAAREAAMQAWLARVDARRPRLPSLSDYSVSRECIYQDEDS